MILKCWIYRRRKVCDICHFLCCLDTFAVFVLLLCLWCHCKLYVSQISRLSSQPHQLMARPLCIWLANLMQAILFDLPILVLHLLQLFHNPPHPPSVSFFMLSDNQSVDVICCHWCLLYSVLQELVAAQLPCFKLSMLMERVCHTTKYNVLKMGVCLFLVILTVLKTAAHYTKSFKIIH